MTRSLGASNSCIPLLKFWCKHMPPNFGIKVILFQNFHTCASDRSIVMGRESWSGVHYLSSSLPAYEPMLQSFTRASSLHGRLDPSFQADYKCLSDSGESNSTTSVMFLFCLLLRVPLAPPDPPWSNSFLWGYWVVRRILVHTVIVSLILVPCRARGSATTVRRILVTSPEFSHHDRRAVLVFARAKMCGHLPLVRFIKCPSEKPQTSFPRFPSHR